MKTKVEIIECLEKGTYPLDGFFNFGAEVLAKFLTFDDAAAFRSEGATPESWGEVLPLDRDTVIAQMGEYMGRISWEKALDHRSISAGRSINKMQAWCWLLDEDDEIDWENYAQYGVPILLAVCQKYGFPVPDGEEEAEMIRRMSQGLPCEDGCEQGCGC